MVKPYRSLIDLYHFVQIEGPLLIFFFLLGCALHTRCTLGCVKGGLGILTGKHHLQTELAYAAPEVRGFARHAAHNLLQPRGVPDRVIDRVKELALFHHGFAAALTRGHLPIYYELVSLYHLRISNIEGFGGPLSVLHPLRLYEARVP